MNYKLGWIGTVALQAFTPEGRELVFDLAEGQAMPNEFKEGDEVDIILHADHPANIEMGMNAGYYEVKHLASGKTVKILHKTSEWRFDKVCKRCDLRIQKSGENSYVYKKPGKVVPTKLENFQILRDAFNMNVCPLCGQHMDQEVSR
jgi:hypothetical protein